ncbi:GNAT family N-acetyltransferase [uncultured Draconibacterium sp.]|uniref:GNAT family N-acetyltransferase n=1 Tax=uncultured Draconibacterium sp. TaxID=1573823 RepID=UPI0025ED8684|nr:GNAT family N-acetyltransferase [uncultured Draconibacterium sp.]
MIIFETERLAVRRLEPADKEYFAELFTDPKVLAPIPQKAFTESEINDRFTKSMRLTLNDIDKQKCACGIFEKGNTKMIGLALFLLNENNENELGYRVRPKYWGKGFGTEIAIGMLEFYFDVLNIKKVTADVNIGNTASVKILDKLMTPVKEFFNERDNCTDRRYELEKKNWLKQRL